jgi:subtilisin family serine protease
MKLKAIIFLMLLSSVIGAAHAQKINWQNLDLKTDSVFGISTEKAYTQLLKGKKGHEVVVAVIDGGVDTNHADLKPVLWRQSKKWGWSFLGSSRGNVNNESLELTRLVSAGQKRFPDPDHLPADTAGLAEYLKLRQLFNQKKQQNKQALQYMGGYKSVADTILNAIGKPEPSIQDIMAYVPLTSLQSSIKSLMLNEFKKDPKLTVADLKLQLEDAVKHFGNEKDYSLNLAFDPRTIVGDRIDDLRQTDYGSADVMGPDATHGSHVSGIIGAVRNNGVGMDGVADHVSILNIRAVPTGDERDKDVANAIIYAVDHGARVINMSFGKPYSPSKSRVDEAVRYAMSKDVLLVHAAGNDGLDLDGEGNYFPNKFYAAGKDTAQAWLNVGASNARDDEKLVASFSNFGKTRVDVFAPGVDIYSTVPGSGYKSLSGTSMAAPVVTGLATLIRSYYPKLTAVQVKEIIMTSVVKVGHDVEVVQKGRKVKVPFADVCVSGGIVNAYQALKMAASY